jgi:hypothetical protein
MKNKIYDLNEENNNMVMRMNRDTGLKVVSGSDNSLMIKESDKNELKIPLNNKKLSKLEKKILKKRFLLILKKYLKGIKKI